MADKGLFADIGDKAKKKLDVAIVVGVIALALLLLLPGLNILGGDDTEKQASSTSYFDADAEHNALKQTLSSIKGAGKVEVMITYRAPDKTPAPVTTPIQSAGSLSGYYGGSSAGTESETCEQRPEVLGVIVVAEGADDISVRVALAGAVQTALGITADRVDVYEMSK